jgi:hypothetical protein
MIRLQYSATSIRENNFYGIKKFISRVGNRKGNYLTRRIQCFSDEGVYNTYVLDSDYKSWALLMHCAEKSKSPRYLSSFIMSREANLGGNVISYLREKLPRYVHVVSISPRL